MPPGMDMGSMVSESHSPSSDRRSSRSIITGMPMPPTSTASEDETDSQGGSRKRRRKPKVIGNVQLLFVRSENIAISHNFTM